MMRQHAVGSDRASRTTPTILSSSSSTRIGVGGFEDSVLALSAGFVGSTNVAIACEALKS